MLLKENNRAAEEINSTEAPKKNKTMIGKSASKETKTADTEVNCRSVQTEPVEVEDAVEDTYADKVGKKGTDIRNKTEHTDDHIPSLVAWVGDFHTNALDTH